MIEKLLEKIKSLGTVSDEMVDRIRRVVKIKKFKAGDSILREGQVCRSACLIIKGLTRSFYINDGKDITSRFMEEGFVVTSWISFYKQAPGNEFIEAIEDTELACIDYSDIEKLYNEFPAFNVVARHQIEYAFYLSELRTQLLRGNTAEEKYKYFIEQFPTLLQRVSLKHIAGYLGMTEETLSRVRSRYHRNQT